MAVEVHHLLSAKASGINFGDVQVAAPATADMVTGWAVNSGSDTTGEEAEVWANAERVSGAGTWVAGPIPTTNDATNGNGWRLTSTAKAGTYAAGNWSFSFRLRRKAGGDAAPMTMGINYLLWKSSNADGSGGSAVGTRQQIAASAVSTGVTLSGVYNPGAITLSNEYLFLLVAAELGTSVSWTIVLREGSTTKVDTTNFTASGGSAGADTYRSLGWRVRRPAL